MKKKSPKITLRGSFHGKMLLLSVLPLLCLAILVGCVSVATFSNTMHKQMEEELNSQCHMVKELYDSLYPGDFSLRVDDNESYSLYKGNVDITNANRLLDCIHNSYGVEVSIFCKDLCVATTMTDSDGNRATLTHATPIIVEDVQKFHMESFYDDVLLNDQKYFASYIPIMNSDFEVFGMFGIYRLSSVVDQRAKAAVMPIVLLCILATFIIGFISIEYSNHLIRRLTVIQRFMRALASGRFDQELPYSAFQHKDELGDLAESGKTMQQSLRQLVEFDALTKLNNRRSGDQKLKGICERARQYGSSYCVGICDIDFFKKVNDTYGHDAGDEVLRRVAKTLKTHIMGKRGFVARWGGEEFLLIFADGDLASATRILEETLDAIRALEIWYQDQCIKVTMSFGLVNADTEACEDAMLKAADELLYDCKENGRNQIRTKDLSKQTEKDS